MMINIRNLDSLQKNFIIRVNIKSARYSRHADHNSVAYNEPLAN